MITFEIAVAFFLGLAAGIIVFGTLRAKLNQEDQNRIVELEELTEALKIEAKTAVEPLRALLTKTEDELEKAKWSLGGRVRGPDEPPIYVMPPGEENTGKCDDARLAWMDKANEAAEMLRTAGLTASAEKIHPATRAAKTQTAKRSNPDAPPSVKERPM